MVSALQFDRVQTLIKAAVEEDGATLLAGGPGRPDGFDKGYFVKPTIFSNVSNDMRIAREEVFGPVLAMIPFDDEEDAVRIANDTPYGLAAGVFSTNLGTAHKLAHRLKAGSVWVNMYHAIDPAVPFGGVKMSGYGREGGTEHLEEYLDTKAIWINAD